MVARELLGQHLCREGIVLRITEVEAYGGPEDSASHARHGRTARNEPMWGMGGHAYLYFCYGMHHMLNVVTGSAGEAAAVLIRACEPVEGLAEIRMRRGGLEGPALLTGPGKVAQALGLDRTFNHHPLFHAGGLELRAGSTPSGILVAARVGIDFADPRDLAAPRRFAVAGTRWVTQARSLR
jgi:DNA-3-methyladenine glycosylase